MAGSKRNKLKKALSPSKTTETPPQVLANDDDNLMNDLFAQLDSRNPTVQAESATVINEIQSDAQANRMEGNNKQDAKARFKARQARKAAVLAQTQLPDDPEQQARILEEARNEAVAIAKICDELNVQICEINPDGHCLYSAVADQLVLLGVLPPSHATYSTLRTTAADFIYSHPDDFIPFLPSVVGEDGQGSLDSGLMTPQQLGQYCTAVRDTALWGGEPEILALSRAYNTPIHVVQAGRPSIVMHNPTGAATEGSVSGQGVARISYHRRMYGLGEHYNSLRPKRIS